LAAVVAGVFFVAGTVAVIHFSKKPAVPAVHSAALSVRFKATPAEAKLSVDKTPLSSGKTVVQPGTHTVEASLDGYKTESKTFTIAAGRSAPLVVSLDLQPLLPELRITSDWPSGQVIVDGGTAELQNGSLVRDSVPAGDHTVKITGTGLETVVFSFTSKAANMPIISGPITAKNVAAVVVSALGPSVRIWSSAGLKGGITEDSLQPISANGTSVTNVSPAGSVFWIDDGRNPRRSLQMDVSSVPTLQVELGAARQTGTITVHSNVPDSTVLVNGTALKQPTVNGTKMLLLEPKTYQISMAHAGYQTVDGQTVDLKQGASKSLEFQLTPSVQKGVLALNKFPPETEVSVDGSSFGTTDSSGSLNKELAAGIHTLTFHKSGYQDVTQKQEIKPSAASSLNGDTVMPLSGSVTFTLSPETARLSYRGEGESQMHDAKGGHVISLRPGAYIVSAEAERFQKKSAGFTIQAGRSTSVNMTLVPETSAARARTIKNMCEDPSQWSMLNGWWHHTAPGSGWLLKNQGNFSISFLKQSSKILFINKVRRIEWAVDWQTNADQVLYVLDEHLLHRQTIIGGQTSETKSRHGMENMDQPRLNIDISAERVVVRNAQGQILDDYKRPHPEAPLGKFGFLGEVALAIGSVR
jgi:hypothetical protein